MKGVVVQSLGAPAVVVDNLEMPEPADDQILVKSIYTAMNPVDGYMAHTGLLILDWPFVLGCDAAGIVVKTGSNAVGPLGAFKVGDEVLGCTRLGSKGYSTCQEYFLMDAALAVPKPGNLTTAQAATVGVGLYTACLGIFPGFNIPIPQDPNNLPPPTGEHVLVLGGSSSVGKFAVQLLAHLGYKVLTTCSDTSSALLRDLGATETFDYKQHTETQLVELIAERTEGKLRYIFDAVASNHDFVKAFWNSSANTSREGGGGGQTYFSTTNDWDPLPPDSFSATTPLTINPVKLGPIGRAEAPELNNTIAALIPLMHALLSSGAVKPAEYTVAGGGDGRSGFEGVIEAWAGGRYKAGAKKIVVELQEA